MLDEGAGPDFFCIGMQKAGTKWLYDSLHRLSGVLDAADQGDAFF